MLIRPNQTVLFQGDSITDCDRDRTDSRSLGAGYPSMVAGLYRSAHPQDNVTFYNRGVSGDRVVLVKERWQQDCLDLKPDVVSILIGINEVWRGYDHKLITPTQEYEEDFRSILTQARDIGAKLIILQPFVLPTPFDRTLWRDDLNEKIAAAHRLAQEFNAAWLPLDEIFAEALKVCPPEYWAADGVHPTPAGHALIAREWLKLAESL